MTYSNTHYESTKTRRIEFSRHALKRAQQRGITSEASALIKAYGEASHDGIGGIRYLMTEQSMMNLYRVIGHTQKLEQLKGVYIVVDSESQNIITIAHRH